MLVLFRHCQNFHFKRWQSKACKFLCARNATCSSFPKHHSLCLVFTRKWYKGRASAFSPWIETFDMPFAIVENFDTLRGIAREFRLGENYDWFSDSRTRVEQFFLRTYVRLFIFRRYYMYPLLLYDSFFFTFLYFSSSRILYTIRDRGRTQESRRQRRRECKWSMIWSQPWCTQSWVCMTLEMRKWGKYSVCRILLQRHHHFLYLTNRWLVYREDKCVVMISPRRAVPVTIAHI